VFHGIITFQIGPAEQKSAHPTLRPEIIIATFDFATERILKVIGHPVAKIQLETHAAYVKLLFI